MLKEKKRRIRKLVIVIIGFTLLLFCLVLLVKKQILFIPCLFYEVTGWYCPGCGMTRAVLCLLQFDFLGMIHNNFLLPFVIILSVWYLICFIRYYVVEEKFLPLAKVYSSRTIWLLCLFVILFGIFRNFSYFDFLKPL